MTLRKPALLFLLVVICFLSCRKNKDDKQPDCKIITATGGSTTYNLIYDSDGRISQVTSMPAKIIGQYQYSGNIVNVNFTQNGVFSNKTIVTKNEQGFAVNVRKEMNQSGTSWTNETLQYEGTKLVKIVSTSSANGSTSTAAYEWKNDNMVKIVTGNLIIDQEFDLTRPSQIGEVLYLEDLLVGAKIRNNKNLIKSRVINGDITNYTYNFDDSGKIASVSEVTNNSTLTYAYTYLCN